MTHPRDSEAWKMFDLKNTSFVEDPRNIRLALATDGINPYRSMNANSSNWPVILIPYNTPPWICMKWTSFILLMIIPGKKMPGNNIDVYLQPLIKELKELWNEGVDAYDSFEKKAFKLHAALMWTISDFPGLGILSRHQFRLNSVRFNGEQEFRNPPKRLSGLDILEQVKDINVTLVEKKRQNTKSKDHLNARKDLKALGCKQDIWPDENGKYASAIFTLTNKGKKAFLSTLKNISVLDGYSSNISRCIDVDNLKINGMLKSHDNHILIQQLLPLAMRTSLPSEVSAILIELCSFFRKLFMIHLVVYLVEEVKLGGPVHYRWMYPIERYLGQLKSYVRNKAQPEGSIAEVDNYLRDYRDIVKKRLRSRTRDTTEIDKKICTNLNKLPDVDKNILISLSQGPYDQARKFSSSDVNGYRFRTLAKDNGLKTQNSGVFGTFGTRSYSSSKDTRMNFGVVPYYGKLVDIIELFYNGFIVLLFKCQWANTTNPRGIKKDNLGFLSVNFTRLIHTGEHEDDEPYIKASEA
ncbi:uncharacterized protein LOC130939747 [Arachis stenosperma]|uniref:uncharacterized protein LOC130939747 n=1 Tax=Arachis stenosperma TaxID=217475 RepID=UPI0025AC4652|nr:uncharacterized protein LOC130939747 [Arachis stenosperma]